MSLKGPKVKNPEQIKVDIQCRNCGKFHTHLPEGTVVFSDLYWWDCSCKSTLVAKVKE